MAIDLLKEVIGIKHGYTNMRGADVAKRANFQIPRTTWGDAMIVAGHLRKYIDPTEDQCAELLAEERGINRSAAKALCASTLFTTPGDFTRTPRYVEARERFYEYHPYTRGGILGLSKIMEVYPYNEEFWLRAIEWARAREEAGEVRHWGDLVMESIKEAVLDLPDTVQEAASAAFDAVDPRKLIPDVSGFATLIKWGSIAGALGLLYWYVLRPKKK